MTTVSVAGRAVENAVLTVALVGNPNCGKTTLFNALTGLRQKVGNYPGVTVEKKEGRAVLPGGRTARLLDLPGLYSLTPHSPDELIAREVLLGLRPETPRPDVILNVVDASNLERNLYMTSQLLDLGLPMVIALTMTDTTEIPAYRRGLALAEQDTHEIGMPYCMPDPQPQPRPRRIRRLLATLGFVGFVVGSLWAITALQALAPIAGLAR